MNLVFFSKPGRYINQEVNSIYRGLVSGAADITVALAFPDLYEIGMSHLGLKILYKIINELPFAAAERVFAPWTDLEGYLRDNKSLLLSLESKRPLRDFDVVGFSLQYELSYSSVLNMLDLGGIPVRRQERGNRDPLVLAGGPCTVNPVPLSPFIDAFVIGDAEEKIVEILDLIRGSGKDREAALKGLSGLEGVFVPGYSSKPISRIFLTDLDSAPYPTSPVVPYTKAVHDRINIEVSRGCSMGCRFCQAGIIYRPVRERSPRKILSLAAETIKNTGYDEVSFTSLSAGDYSCMIPLLKQFNRMYMHKKIAISLPSIRVGAVNDSLLQEVQSVRRGGFTIAPEASTDRLRRVINKDFSEEDYEAALDALFRAGWQTIKLYFMIGLPTEEWADIESIVQMARKALQAANKYRNGRININVGISPFVPKPHTPFQWTGQEAIASLVEKKNFILRGLTKKAFTVKSHNEVMSLLEAAIARGDERVGDVIEEAWKAGARLDGWSECFDFRLWERAMEKTGTDLGEIARHQFSPDLDLPWSVVDPGVRLEFLKTEYQNALNGEKTPSCSLKCHACGLRCSSRQFLAGDEVLSLRVPQGKVPRFAPVKVRVKFSKTGALKYLSHLELVSAFFRALRRADVPLCYSEGFHPAPKVAFGPALGVGIESECEYFDMEVFPPFDILLFPDEINRVLPEGLRVLESVFIDRRTPSLSSFIKCYEYFFVFTDEAAVDNFLSRKKQAPFDSMIFDSAIITDKTVRVLFTEKEKTIRISSILENLFGTGLDRVSVRRTGMWGFEGRPVSPTECSVISGKEIPEKRKIRIKLF